MSGGDVKQEQRKGLGSYRPESQAPPLWPLIYHAPVLKATQTIATPAISRRKPRKVASRLGKTAMGIRGWGAVKLVSRSSP